VVQVSYSSYLFYLFIWHKEVNTYQDFLELYNTTNKYKPSTNLKHNSKIKEFHDHDYRCDKIEVYKEGITEKGHDAPVIKAKMLLRYSYFDEERTIFHLVDYFSCQYAISKQMDKCKMNEFINHNTQQVKLENLSNSDNWLWDRFKFY
ncbi:16044_t:CDS:1, partial [Dentiscutata erythropus]